MSPPAGPTRCYWSLLSGDLQFIYLDPVLQYHLADQAEALAGKSLLDFVHPDEQSSAKHDLGTVLESRTLHGSVTRVRFARLSKIRRDLGYTGPASDFPAADKIAVDANYMAVDVVINWAAEGLVLCFIHAIVDIDPAADNDQTSKTSWSNWCGTPVLNSEQVQMLFKRLLMCAPQTAPTARVFQILNNNTAKDLVISWPPADQPSTREFARLANDINVNVVNTDAKTSCTRRFKSAQLVQDVGHVESVFIPHGSVIFACHKVDSPPNSTMPSSYDHHHTPYALPGATNPPYYPNPNPSAYSYQPPPPPWDRYYPPYEASRNHEGGGAGQYTYLPPPPSPPEDSVPPPRRRVSPPPPGQSQRGHGNRPVGVLKCSSCKATSSPEWRKGPSGRKELCNACGLRYARSRAKKEGSVPSSSQHHKSSGNGRKEKSSLSLNVVKREREQNSATPPRSAGSSVASSYDYGGAPGYDYYRSYRNGGGSGGSSPDGGGGGGGGGSSNGSFPNYDDAPPPAGGGRYYAHTSPLAAPPTTNGGVSYERRYEKWDRDDGRR